MANGKFAYSTMPAPAATPAMAIANATDSGTTVLTKDGEHVMQSAGVRARIQYAQHRGQWVAEFRFTMSCGVASGCTLPLTATSEHCDSEIDAVANAAQRMLDSVQSQVVGETISKAKQRAIKKLTAWATAFIEQSADMTAVAIDQSLACVSFVDVCAGIGAMHLGFASEGAICCGAVELDAEAAKTYRTNHPGNYPIYADVCKVTAAMLGNPQVFCAGFPCQSVSISGKREGFAQPKKSGLFFEVARIVGEFKNRPQVVLLENVNGLLSHNGGKTFNIVLDTMEELGYSVTTRMLNASDFGTPQMRERVFLVCIHDSVIKNRTTPFVFPSSTDATKVVADILEKSPDCKPVEREMVRTGVAMPTTKSNQIEVIGLIEGKTSQGYRVASPLGKGITLCANSGGAGPKTGLYLIEGKVRTLSTREAARMQGFPESFIPHDRPAIAKKQFGNSIAVPVVAAIAEQLSQFVQFHSTQEIAMPKKSSNAAQTKSTKQKPSVAKLVMDQHMDAVCKKLNSKKCPDAHDALMVALNLHHAPFAQMPDGILVGANSPHAKLLPMDAASIKFAIAEIVEKYEVHDPEAIRHFIRHKWTQFKPDRSNAPQGKYFTPSHVSKLFEELVNPLLDVHPGATILDMAAGHGALTAPFERLDCKVADIDEKAVAVLKEMGVKDPLLANSLIDVSRGKFGVGQTAPLLVIGNPPFNDGTSQHKRAVKAAAGSSVTCDSDLQTRDTGVAFMLAAAKLDADAIVFIHPLSYLIKSSNFARLASFALKYKLESGIVISSAEFALGGKPFPLVLAVYRKGAMTFADIEQFEFPIYGNVFNTFLDTGTRLKLSMLETTQGFIRSTTPNKGQATTSTEGLYQYNYRDINFLESSGNLTDTESASTIPVEMATLPHYCYLNCQKRYFDSDFMTGNLTPLVRKADFNDPVFVDSCIYDAIMCNHKRISVFNPANPASIVAKHNILQDAQKKAATFKGIGINPYTAFVNFWTKNGSKDALAPFFQAYFTKLKTDNLIKQPSPALAALLAAQTLTLTQVTVRPASDPANLTGQTAPVI